MMQRQAIGAGPTGGVPSERVSGHAFRRAENAPVFSGGGEALPIPVRKDFERRFGWGFASIRIHSDGVAAESARALNALAFTRENVLMGGEATQCRDSLGVARVLAPQQVALLSKRLDQRGVDAIMDGLDIHVMRSEGIPLADADEEVTIALRASLVRLVEFYHAAAGDALLIYTI
jgi:hypothetical protein